MSTQMWIGDKMYLVDESVREYVDELTDKNERLREAKGVCAWTSYEPFDGEESWETECGTLWTFIEGGIKDNGAVYCQKCGRLIAEALKENKHE